jgi:hypothetical protein
MAVEEKIARGDGLINDGAVHDQRPQSHQREWSWNPFKSTDFKPDYETPDPKRTFKRNQASDSAVL